MYGDRAWIEIDREALRHNVRYLRSLLPEGCLLMPAVKANAYGHGSALVAGELNAMGVRAFCVATAEEGAELRRSGTAGDILVLGFSQGHDLTLAQEHGLILTAAGLDHARLLDESGRRLRVHLAIDTGMHRLGESAGDIDRLERICKMKNLHTEGAYTHLCTEDGDFSRRQAAEFKAAVSALRQRGCRIEKAHLLASSGLLRFPELGGDYARVGIALYGLGSLRGQVPEELRPVLSLKARVAAVKELEPGQGAGYGLRYTAYRESRLAVLTAGYADGLPRALSMGRGGALIRGKYAPTAGLMCMDQTLVDVTGIPDIRPGDEAVLIGRQGGGEISAYDLAQAAGTITNEILSRLGQRPERVLV